MRQPDIEIYLKDTDHQAVAAWLAQRLGEVTPWQPQGRTLKCQAGKIPITWLPKACGSWHSLLLESAETPWPDDLCCAREAYTALHTEVRCAAGGWQETADDESAAIWISISTRGEHPIQWASQG